MKITITFAVVLTTAVAFAGCQAKEREGPPATDATTALAREEGAPKPATVTFTTSDGWEIYATYWDAGEGKPAAILLHMLIADRRSYDDFGAKLAAAGLNVLAPDSRGHGDSLKKNGKTRRYTEFDDEEHKSSVKDVAAAKDSLAQKGADTSKLVVVGASIGANFALNYGADDADVRAVVLLSPGLEYHGVETVAAMAEYGDRPAYLVASEEDGYSADSIGKLDEIAPGAEFKMFEGAGHGTKIFRAEPAFEDTLVDWLAAQVK
jgi:pimeloyl-ACP methyl ester carboxylesterase